MVKTNVPSQNTVYRWIQDMKNGSIPPYIRRNKKNNSVVINSDSQAAIMALKNTKMKSKTTLDAVVALNKLGENNQVLIRWIPAHSGYLGNEKADSLAKRRANKTDATLLKLPIPKVT